MRAQGVGLADYVIACSSICTLCPCQRLTHQGGSLRVVVDATLTCQGRGQSRRNVQLNTKASCSVVGQQQADHNITIGNGPLPVTVAVW